MRRCHPFTPHTLIALALAFSGCNCEDERLGRDQPGSCEPDFVQNVPPDPEGWADRMAEYDRTSELYFEHLNCPPPPFDGGWCVTVDEPEQVTPAIDTG